MDWVLLAKLAGQAQPITLDEIWRLAVAILLGAVIGFEREWSGKPAGLRTNIIICLGAAVFAIVAYHFADGEAEAIARVATGVVTGVGFIGAGAVIQERRGVHGMTTAASIWLVTAVGMACGLGMYVLASTVTGMVLIVLLGMHPVSGWIRRKSPEGKRLAERERRERAADED